MSSNNPSTTSTSGATNTTANNQKITSSVASSSQGNTPLGWIFIFFIEYSSLISGLGAVFYAVGTFMNVDFPTLITNNHGKIAFNLLILVCGIITICEWLFVDLLINGIKNS
jgi:hypothetical protein